MEPDMRRLALAVVLPLALLAACAKTVLVPVPPRVDLKPYGTLGVVEFATNYDRAYGARAARLLQEQIQEAQPGTRFIELGDEAALLAAVGARQLDPAALKRIGEKYGVAAVFAGELRYSEPTVDVRVTDATKMQGSVRTEVRADISGRLLETASGASVWTRSAWVRRPIADVKLSGERGVSGGVKDSNPREAMVPALVGQITQDFRPTSVRRPAP
jgi:hypothetical protein